MSAFVLSPCLVHCLLKGAFFVQYVSGYVNIMKRLDLWLFILSILVQLGLCHVYSPYTSTPPH